MNQKKNPDGTYTFDLYPIKVGSIGPILVHVTIKPQVLNKATGVITLPVSLTGSFKGDCGFTITPNPKGGLFLQSSWYNMVPQGAAILLGKSALKAHFLAEDNALKNLNLYLNGKPTYPISASEAVQALFHALPVNPSGSQPPDPSKGSAPSTTSAPPPPPKTAAPKTASPPPPTKSGKKKLW